MKNTHIQLRCPHALCRLRILEGRGDAERRKSTDFTFRKTTANYSTLHGQCMCRTESVSCSKDRKKANSLTLHGRLILQKF